jgi:hypothetical protein
MSERRISARRLVALAATTSLLALASPLPAVQAAETGSVQIVQAVPKASVRVTIDGKQVKSGVGLGTILGPFSLSAGKHTVRFADPKGDVSMSSSISVGAGSSTDVVLHRPASVSGEPVVNVYRTPRGAIGPGKARVLVAHTATVPAADVRVDGKVVFTNIANGEYADADVPAGGHKVELLPTGQTKNPILGPIDVTLAPRTVTMVYAVGTPSDGSMKTISHSAVIASDGTVEPGSITTGSAGRAADLSVTTFDTPDRRAASGGLPSWLWVAGAAALLLSAGSALRGRGTRAYARSPHSSGG